MQVLIVDDEQLVRWFLERALKKWGHKVISVSSVQDAIKVMGDKDFDVVFTDLRMPEGNGTFLIRKVRELTENTKIVVCSAFVTPEMIDDFNAKGILTLKKPFRLEELENTLRLCTS